jgi:iron(III) transport system substrate-binding protein
MRVVLVALLAGCRVELGAPAGPTAACAGDTPTGEVWIYTSMYQTVIDALEPQLRQAYPDLEPRWFQAGSEKVAQRVETEWDAGGSPACLLMTSDPFWFAEIASEGRLAPHLPPTVLRVDRSLVDPDGRWVTSRQSLMVMARNETRVAADAAPERIADLVEPQWRDRFSMGDPLSSGTMFTTLAFLERDDGFERVRALRDNGLIAAGGNSSVLTRVETGEREIGIVLLENLLAARRKGSPAVPIFPEDGAILVPGPIALTAACPNPVGARAVYDFLMSEPGQSAIVAGDMYAALPELPPPAGAPALDTLAVRPWPPGFVDEVVRDKAALKERYATLVAGG